MTDQEWDLIRRSVFIDSDGNVAVENALEEQVPDLDLEELLDIIDDDDMIYEDDDGNEVIDWDTVEQIYEDGDAF